MEKVWNKIESSSSVIEQAMLMKNYLALSSNLITGHLDLQSKYFPIVINNQKLLDQIFELAWDEFEDLNTCQIGEICMKNLLVFIHNSCVQNLENLESASDILYRVHRYVYTSQSYAKEEKEEVTQELEEVLDWYTLIMKLVLKADGLLTVYYNKFLSKKDKTANET